MCLIPAWALIPKLIPVIRRRPDNKTGPAEAYQHQQVIPVPDLFLQLANDISKLLYPACPSW